MTQPYAFSFGQSNFIAVDIDKSRAGTTVVPVAFAYNGKSIAIQGSAFCVAKVENDQAIFVTAKHVIEPILDNPEIRAHVLLPNGPETNGHRSLMGVEIFGISAAETHNDAALLIANTRKVNRLNAELFRLFVMRVKFTEPQIGQPCMALGYPQEPGTSDYKMYASRGIIEETHPTRRDRSLSTFPTFRTDALYKHGMSGGPVIDTSGRAIGLISHGYEAGEAENVTGYGACLGAILEMQVPLLDTEGKVNDTSVIQLADMGYLSSVNDPPTTLRRTDDGITLSWDGPKASDSDAEP